MWRSTNEETNDWKMLPIEHPNVDMSKVTNYVDPATGLPIVWDAPKLNASKADAELNKFRSNPFYTFAPVKVSEESGR